MKMLRVLRLNKWYMVALVMLVLSPLFTLTFIILDDPVIYTSIGRFFAGFAYGAASVLIMQALANAHNTYYNKNINPNYTQTYNVARLTGNPLTFGPADDSFGKDLLYYLPFKKWIGTFQNQIGTGFWHIIIASYSKCKKRLRLFDIIDMSNNSHGKSHHQCIRLTYDMDITNSSENKITVIPRQVVLYDTDDNVRIAFDGDIFKSNYSNIDAETKQQCKDLCQYVLDNAEFLADGFESYLREVLRGRHYSVKSSLAIYKSKSIRKGHIFDLRDFKPDAKIEIINDDFLEILQNYKYYLK